MIIIMKSEATEKDVTSVVDYVKQRGFSPHVTKIVDRTIVSFVDDGKMVGCEQLSVFSGVNNVVLTDKPYFLVTRDFKPTDSIIDVGGVKIGGKNIVVIAGPCAVETEDIVLRTAEEVKSAGAVLFRGGAYKPRISPYSFQGLGEIGLKILSKAREKTGLGIVTEVMESSDVQIVAEYADVLQIGARNMQNTKLLQAVSKINKPVLLKRNYAATMKEFLLSAEYLLSGGNEKVILCERGIRTFVEYARNTLDLSIIPAIKQISHLPIIVDPSHATGRNDLVVSMSRAAIAAGADGLLVEVHPNPQEALSDGFQSITPETFQQLMKEVKAIANAVERGL